jgi:hypothetical protein
MILLTAMANSASLMAVQAAGAWAGWSDSMSEAQAADERHRPVDFTIDGKPYRVDDPAQTAAALLRLAGFDPANYDLAEVRQGEKPKRFSGDQSVKVHQGEEFITIRHSAPVE